MSGIVTEITTQVAVGLTMLLMVLGIRIVRVKLLVRCRYCGRVLVKRYTNKHEKFCGERPQ